MDIEQVKKLVQLVEQSGIAELEVSEGETAIRIRKDAPAPVAPLPAASAAPPPAAAAPAPGPAAGRPAHWREVASPIVGTFYRAPSPGSPPFVEVGGRVAAGQTLCIIEAMKVMNEIEAEFAGILREVLAQDGAPVEAEAPLFLVEPA